MFAALLWMMFTSGSVPSFHQHHPFVNATPGFEKSPGSADCRSRTRGRAGSIATISRPRRDVRPAFANEKRGEQTRSLVHQDSLRDRLIRARTRLHPHAVSGLTLHHRAPGGHLLVTLLKLPGNRSYHLNRSHTSHCLFVLTACARLDFISFRALRYQDRQLHYRAPKP